MVSQSSVRGEFGSTRDHNVRPFGFSVQHLQVAAPREELLFYGGSMAMVWIMGAASLSGYILTALFAIVAVWRLFRSAASNLIADMPKRSALRHYTIAIVSLVLFFLLAVRVCYIATVIVDTVFRNDLFEKVAVKSPT
jgi:hypothetical protein